MMTTIKSIYYQAWEANMQELKGVNL